MVVSPFFVKPGMMVSGVVRNDHDGTAAPDTRAASHLQEGKEGHRVEFARFPEKTETFHLATAPHQSILRCGASDDATARGPWFPVVPTCGTGSRAAESALHRWPTGSLRHYPSPLGVFFMRLLPFGIGLGKGGTWFAQSKTQPPEQALALSHA